MMSIKPAKNIPSCATGEPRHIWVKASEHYEPHDEERIRLDRCVNVSIGNGTRCGCTRRTVTYDYRSDKTVTYPVSDAGELHDIIT